MDIPGYRIQRQIGSGGSSRVYLALQHTFGSPVAIKVLSPQASRDEDQRTRFLGEATVARSLDHPNIVRVVDVGETAEAAYLVMEYVRGGDLNHNLRAGLHIQNLLALVKEIAGALGYAHGKGVVHGDVKPENILISEQGTAMLTDFGIASQPGRVVDSGKVRGTPGYMSPEQAAGRDIDGRSDFFSLGVVLYLMLTGRLPFDRQSHGGIQPGRDRLATLPLQMAAFEEVVQRFLARSPEDRFRSAPEIVHALDAVRTGNALPNAVVKTSAVSTAEIAALGSPREGPGAGSDVRRYSRARRIGAAGTVLGVGLLIGAAVYLGDDSGTLQRALAAMGWIEHPDAVVAWQEAEERRRDPNRNLVDVVAAYRAVLDIDRDRAQAQAAIDELGRQWKEDIGRLIDQGDLDTAREKLAELDDAFAGDPESTGLSDRLEERGQAVAFVEQSIRLLDSYGLADERAVDSAIATLKEALSLHPGNPAALAALDNVALYYANVAREYSEAGDGPSALEAMERAERANRTFDGVEDLRQTVTAAVAAHDLAQAQFDAMLQQAAALRESGALVEAIEMYRSVLVIEPDAAVAVQGFEGTSSDVLAEFQALLDRDRLDDATTLRDLATKAGIADNAVDQMRRLHDAEMGRIADVARLIREAEAFMQDGYVTGPNTADNAVARLRDALALDADNADGIRLRSMAATRLADVAVEAYHAGMVEEGMEYLDLALAVTPGITRWRVQREEWQADLARDRAKPEDALGDGGSRHPNPF
ncbi:MAG: protein kinase [Gammaproteobacteria bacterium]|nr:protein kinase [Gammaproteobacteria bacterium]